MANPKSDHAAASASPLHPGPFLGLRSCIYKVEDLAGAKSWYSKVLGAKPYFDETFYVGFDINGFELGLDPDMSGVVQGNGQVALWRVHDIEATHANLLLAGATAKTDIAEVGGGIKVATVRDPFGNFLGLIEEGQAKAA